MAQFLSELTIGVSSPKEWKFLVETLSKIWSPDEW